MRMAWAPYCQIFFTTKGAKGSNIDIPNFVLFVSFVVISVFAAFSAVSRNDRETVSVYSLSTERRKAILFVVFC